MTEHTRKGTLQSMGAVGGNGNGNGNGHHHDDAEPMTEYEPRSEMKTPPGGTPLGVFLKMTQEDKNAYIHGELVAIREKQSLQESERGNRESVRKSDYERREAERDGKIIDLTVKVETAMMDARSDRQASAKQYGEITLTLEGHDRALDQVDKDIVELGRAADEEAKKAEDRHHTLMTAIGGVKTQVGENNVDIRRVNGRITLHDDRLDAIEMHDNAQDARIVDVVADLGVVPHKLDHRESLSDLTPQQIKQREENAAKGTGIRGDIARIDSNVVAMNGSRLALAGAVLVTPGALVEIGKAFGPEWAFAGAAAASLLGIGIAKTRTTRARIAAWWAARRIKVSTIKDPEKKS